MIPIRPKPPPPPFPAPKIVSVQSAAATAPSGEEDSTDATTEHHANGSIVIRDDDELTPESLANESLPDCCECRRERAKFLCSACNNRWYCSEACQAKDWEDGGHEFNCAD